MRAQNVFVLTGTPFGRDVTDLWAQMHLVDNGHSIGETLGLFRAAFFKQKDSYWGGFEYTFDKKMDKELKRCLAHASIRYEANAADLPSVVPIVKKVSLLEEAEAYYAKARAQIIAAKGNHREMKNAFLRMRQISSGFIGYHDDEAGTKAQFVFDEKPKLDMLLSIIASIREDRKIIVFNEFIFSGQSIARELTDMKVKHVHVYGGTKNPEAAIRQFNNDPKTRVLILQNSMVKGLNIQIAQYGIFYESPVAVIDRKQAWRRVERQHSAHRRVFIYDLVTRGTMDEKILLFHKQGADLFKALMSPRRAALVA
jgi:SNF2 family DNA or RNA helicase